MPTTLEEFLAQLCVDSTSLYANEESTKLGAVQPVLSLLGWNVHDGREVRPEFPVEADRVDDCLITGSRKTFVEAKAAGKNLGGHQEQLLDYAFRYGVELADLTNGLEWWLYLPLKRGAWQERRFAVINVQGDAGAARRLQCFLGREAVASGAALQAAQRAIIEGSLPRAWGGLCDELHESLIAGLAQRLKDLTGYDPEMSRLAEFLEQKSGSLLTRPRVTQGGDESDKPEVEKRKADQVLEILRDGQWHTAPELREKLRTSSINHVLKALYNEGKVKFFQDKTGNRVRLGISPNGTVPESQRDLLDSESSKYAGSPYTAQSKLRRIFEDLQTGLPKGEIENRARTAGLDPAVARSRLIKDGKNLRGWRWELCQADRKEYIKVIERPKAAPD